MRANAIPAGQFEETSERSKIDKKAPVNQEEASVVEALQEEASVVEELQEEASVVELQEFDIDEE